jgi:hypothetical protein
MNKLPLIWIIIFFCTLPLFAQSVDTAWVRRYNGPANNQDGAVALTVDARGNCYVTGASMGRETWNDYTTIKYDVNGNEQWMRRYNGPGNYEDGAHDITVDCFGNVYVTGGSFGSNTSTDYATVKYDSIGNEIWVRRYNGPGNSSDDASAVAVDFSGNIYVTGSSLGIGTGYDYANIKYHPNGDTAWVRRFDGARDPGNGASGIEVDRSGNVYVTGADGTVKYDSTGRELWIGSWVGGALAVGDSGYVYTAGSIYGDGGDFNYATVKYRPDGDTAWLRRYNGPGDYSDLAEDIAVDDSGNVYVTGSIWGIETSQDYATIKYDPHGNEQWVRRYNGPGNSSDMAFALALDDSGNIYVTGGSNHDVIQADYATIKYDPNGNELWVQRYDGPANYGDHGMAIAVDSSNNVYVTGASWGTWYDYATIKYVQKSKDYETKDWKIYQYRKPGFEIRYPADILKVSKEGEKVILTHSIPFEHPNPCAFSDESPATVKELTDFRVTLETISKSFKETIATYEGGSITQYYLLDDTLRIEPGFIDKMSIGELNGYRIAEGVEGCGFFAYYFPLDQNNTLRVERSYITELLPVMPDREKYLRLPGVIPPDEEERLFNLILSSFKLQK